ncbi:MAG: ribose-5-phosphate isomerase RpiA [Amoebophilaceae bacterium TMED152]|nr:ribose 5-phosphate isomerase A [Gammaproteobacteria bacterium]RPH01975.1 MAG: ribose-5-phosphate isomerase RpiA [Amoebophilaceae bacterium TMED152]|tara:strand:- start:3775 stop:4443 length:669 start_codon:yes stop_codon:yes gene_type:complete
MSEKYNAALGAFEQIKNIDGPLDIGIGTGSTTDIFTKEFLPKIRTNIHSLYSSSIRTTDLLKSLNFTVHEGKPNKILDLYIDGADEVDKDLNLIKGGGGAHTNEKIIAASANYFICIVDSSKLVETLGSFPLPIEVLAKDKENVIQRCQEYTQKITARENLSDSGNILLDLHEMQIFDPLQIEKEINDINGVVEVGIFAVNKPEIVIVGKDDGYNSIESSIA